MPILFFLLFFIAAAPVHAAEKIKVAIMPFDGLTQEQNDFLADAFAGALSAYQIYTPLTRSDSSLAQVMKEYRFQSLGLSDEAALKRLGKALNADYVLSGKAAVFGGSYALNANIIDVETLAVQSGGNARFGALDEAVDKIAPIVETIHGIMKTRSAEAARRKIDPLLKKYEGRADLTGKEALLPGLVRAYEKSGVDAAGIKGERLLHSAAKAGLADLTEALLQAGAAVDIRDDEGWTPLAYAARDGQSAAAAVLLAYGADVLAQKNDDGWMPLHLASYNDHKEMAELLISKGAAIEAPDASGTQPLHWAAFHASPEMIDLLLFKGASLEAANQQGMRPLHLAALAGRAESVQFLISKGADFSALNKNGNMPLHLAAQNGHVAVLEILLNLGSFPSAKGEFGRTALHHAAERNRAEAAALLLRFGADSAASDNENGSDPLHLAAYFGSIDVLRLLIESGASPNTQNKWGTTALHNAAQNGQARSVELLLQGGASPFVRDKTGKTPYDYARAGGYEDIARLLRP